MPVHNAVNAPVLSHFGVFCRDLDTMVEFYRSTFDLVLTDRGGEGGHTMPFTLAFLSADPAQHHQLVLASGRGGADSPSTVMQISFKVQSLDALRNSWQRAETAGGATKLRGLNHGNALSIYFLDLEENTVEVYLDTPRGTSPSRTAIPPST